MENISNTATAGQKTIAASADTATCRRRIPSHLLENATSERNADAIARDTLPYALAES
jgi:hypothetical protein